MRKYIKWLIIISLIIFFGKNAYEGHGVHTIISFLSIFLLSTFIMITGLHVHVVGRFLYGLFTKMLSARKKEKPKLPKYFSKKILLGFIIVCYVFHFSLYFQQRMEWMGSDNAHLKAKEYFVLNKVIFFYSKLTNHFIKPDKALFQPFVAMHRSLTKQGFKYIPENDAERAVWKYMFDLYFYSRLMYIPAIERKGLPSYTDDIYHLMDDSYAVLHSLANDPMADEQMNNSDKILSFLNVSMYYGFFHASSLTPRSIAKGFDYFAVDEELPKRNYELLEYLKRFRKEWKSNPMLKSKIKNNPNNILAYLFSVDSYAVYLLHKEIMLGKFACDLPIVELYISTRKEFEEYAMKGKDTSFQKLSRKQKRIYTDIMTFKDIPMFYRYVLGKYCGVELIGVGNFTEREENILNTKHNRDKVKRIKEALGYE